MFQRSSCYSIVRVFVTFKEMMMNKCINWYLIVYGRCLGYKVLANISQRKRGSNSSDPDLAVS